MDVGVPRVGNIGDIGLEVTLVVFGVEVTLMTLSWKGCWCPQGGEHWWHWVGSDVGGIGAEVTLVTLSWKRCWCPQGGGTLLALGLK